MNCAVCGADIPKGQKYKGDRYKNINFCSLECYERYIKGKDRKNAPRIALTDYLDNLFVNANFPMLTKQIRAMETEYNLSDAQLLYILRYAVQYEGHTVDDRYGMGQFEKYIGPAIEFYKSVKQAQNVPDMTIDYHTIPVQNKRRFRTPVDFD